MTFHSKSVVGFGQMLNRLAQGIADGEPVPALLDAVKQHFSAQVVILHHAGRDGAPVLTADSAFGPVYDQPDPGFSHAPPTLRDLVQRFQHITATEPGRIRGTDCALWIFRDRDALRFDNEEPALASIVVAQIARALVQAARFHDDSSQIALYCAALERLNVGVILTDATGRALKVSDVADRMLAARDGIQVQAGRLRAMQVSEDRDLHTLLRAMADAPTDDAEADPRGLSLTGRSGLRTLGLVARPAGHGLVAIYLRDSGTDLAMESDFVRQIFDLTPAEAAVTRRLASGLSLEDTATSLAISRNTARAHLRSIFSKNGITRQTELVRLVLNSAAVLGGVSERAA